MYRKYGLETLGDGVSLAINYRSAKRYAYRIAFVHATRYMVQLYIVDSAAYHDGRLLGSARTIKLVAFGLLPFEEIQPVASHLICEEGERPSDRAEQEHLSLKSLNGPVAR